MIRDVYSHRAVQLCLSLLSIVVLGSVFPKLLPGWLAYTASGWVRPLRWTLSTLTDVGLAVAMFAVGYIREARSCLETERECLRAEQCAFLEFAEQIQQLSVPSEPSGGSSPLLINSTPDKKYLQRIQDTYRETVMAVPHYEDEYGEDLQENMAIELSPEIATAVVEGNHYSPQLQHLLVNQARLASHRREDLLEIVTAEDSSLTEAQQQLHETTLLLEQTVESSLKDHSFSELQTHEKALHTRIERCEQLLTDRQEKLHQRSRKSSRPEKQLYQYLYTQVEVTFPVLNATLETIQKLRVHRQNVIRELTHRV